MLDKPRDRSRPRSTVTHDSTVFVPRPSNEDDDEGHNFKESLTHRQNALPITTATRLLNSKKVIMI